MPQPSTRIILSCEHGGNRIPANYRNLFKNKQKILDSHRGYDIGALSVARWLAKRLGLPLFFSQTSRLLVDLNRSLHHPKVFSAMVKACDEATRRSIIHDHYLPYRQTLEAEINTLVAARHNVLHLSIHSFTPELNGRIRKADIGLLYDPARTRELSFCKGLQQQLTQSSAFIIRRNYPYHGNADGLTTWLRRQFPARHYRGIEIEMNQKHLVPPHNRYREMATLLHESIQAITDH